jgi:prepilin-type N-terminal cleavage/methylation domain-containing protein
MNNIKQSGFSLIELLLVVVIIGVIASIGVPVFRRSLAAAENSSTNATLKVMLSAQTTFYSQNGRYGRLDEINNLHNGSLGQVTTNQLTRGKFTYEMIPATPTNAQLKDGFQIKATKATIVGDSPYIIDITHAGYSAQIFP